MTVGVMHTSVMCLRSVARSSRVHSENARVVRFTSKSELCSVRLRKDAAGTMRVN